MNNLGPEQSGLGDTLPLLLQAQRERAWNTTTDLYPDARAIDLEALYAPKSKRIMVKMAGAGKKSILSFYKGKVNWARKAKPKSSTRNQNGSRSICRR